MQERLARKKTKKNKRTAVSKSIRNLQRVKLLAGDVFIHRRQLGEREAGKVPVQEAAESQVECVRRRRQRKSSVFGLHN